MKFASLCVAVLVSLGASIGYSAETLELDSKASEIKFVGKKAEGQHEGGFKEFVSSVTADFDNPSASSLELTIKAESLWSDDEKLTNHLKNPDFFDVRKYTRIKFKTTSIEVKEGETEGQSDVVMVGELTLLAKTEPLKVPAKATVTDKTVTVDAVFKLDRTRWGMTYGEGKINNDVDVTAHLVFNR